MNDQEFFDLAVKVIAGKATAEERAALASAVASEPRLKEELEELRASASVAKEVLPLVSALESEEGELPAYARERLQTKVRETLGRPPALERKLPLSWRWFWALAPAAAVVVLLLVFVTHPKQPIIQLAMLDIAGQTRGAVTNGITLLQAQWKTAEVKNFEKAEDLEAWEKDWPDKKTVIAKVVFDPASAEVRLLIRSHGQVVKKTVPVEPDLAAALRQVEAFIKAQTEH